MDFPFLTVITFLPAVAGLIVLALPPERKTEAKVAALATGAFTLLLSLYIYFGYDMAAGGYQFVENYAWIPQLGISYHMGVNGYNLPMILLTAVVLTTGVMISWGIEDRVREFMAFLLFLSVGVFGVFLSLDLFLFFFLLEVAVFPKYLMIIMWGSPKTREYGGMKLTLYLFIGSIIALVGLIGLVIASGTYSFDMLVLEQTQIPVDFQLVWFPVVFIGFAIIGAVFPFHSWAPDGHVAAPTAISMMLAGVEMKVGVFACIRVAMLLMPEGAQFWLPALVILATINVVYGAYIAMVQKDFKYIIGFSSVSHMGLVLIGFATLNNNGILGAGLQMFSHGVMTAMFFAIVGMVYDRAHTRMIPELGGLAQKMPWAAVGFLIASFASMGMPGFSGFVAEIPIYMGIFQARVGDVSGYPAWFASLITQPWYFPLIAVIIVISIVLTAAYLLRAAQKVFFGALPAHLEHVSDVSVLDKISIAMLCGMMILLGVYPSIMAPLVQSAVPSMLQLLGVR